MSVTIRDGNEKIIHVSKMQDGQIGEIVSWLAFCYVGKIVQRYGDNLIVVGEGFDESWANLFEENSTLPKDCRVQILSNKTALIICDNE